MPSPWMLRRVRFHQLGDVLEFTALDGFALVHVTQDGAGWYTLFLRPREDQVFVGSREVTPSTLPTRRRAGGPAGSSGRSSSSS